VARSAHCEAMGYFEQVLSALLHLQEARDTREQAIDLWFALRTALMPSGDFGRILATLHEAEAIARGPHLWTCCPGAGLCRLLTMGPSQHIMWTTSPLRGGNRRA
jgi:hypothetical protein